MFSKLIDLPLHEEWIEDSCLLAALSLFCLGFYSIQLCGSL